jgi:predicted RNA binding protein YcfA (HicA-like mRNA interferase family)
VVRRPRVSGAQAVRALEELGFAVARQRGSHIVMRRGSSGCVVPNHRELKLGTLMGAEMSRILVWPYPNVDVTCSKRPKTEFPRRS